MGFKPHQHQAFGVKRRTFSSLLKRKPTAAQPIRTQNPALQPIRVTLSWNSSYPDRINSKPRPPQLHHPLMPTFSKKRPLNRTVSSRLLHYPHPLCSFLIPAQHLVIFSRRPRPPQEPKSPTSRRLILCLTLRMKFSPNRRAMIYCSPVKIQNTALAFPMMLCKMESFKRQHRPQTSQMETWWERRSNEDQMILVCIC